MRIELYILAIEVTNMLFEGLMLVLAIICVLDIYQKSEKLLQRFIEFFKGIFYGVVLELVTISDFHFYKYGSFLLMILDVPLAIGIGWGVIIYTARLIIATFDISEFQKTFIAGILALNIDLSMDIIAVKLHFWTWGFGNSYEYFFIPFGNF